MEDKDSTKGTPQTVQTRKLSKKKTEKRLVIANHCKNCGTVLGLDQRFCPSCGAKRIYNRLTTRNLFEDFSERFLNIENAFLKTFIALWTQPEDVINGYINGLRKKYMSAFSYFAVALTLGSIYIFVFRNWFMDDAMGLNDLFQGGYQVGGDGSKADAEVAETVMSGMQDIVNTIFDYNSFFSFTYVPLYAIISKLVFWNYKQVNFIEHVVIYLYAYSQTQIVSNVLMIIFGWSIAGQVVVSSIISILPFFYTAYVLYRIFGLTIEKLVLKTLLFLAIVLPVGLIFFALIGGGMYAVGMLDPFIDTIKEQADVQNAAKVAKAVKDSIVLDSIRISNQTVKDTLTSIKMVKDSLP